MIDSKEKRLLLLTGEVTEKSTSEIIKKIYSWNIYMMMSKKKF